MPIFLGEAMPDEDLRVILGGEVDIICALGEVALPGNAKAEEGEVA